MSLTSSSLLHHIFKLTSILQQNKMHNSCQDNINKYEIIKIQSNQVLMRHKDTRKIFRYVESLDFKNEIATQCEHIIVPLRLQTGYLFDAGLMNLTTQIQNIIRSGQKCNFDQCQIVNTIQPILRVLECIHRNGQIHGSICPENIIINQMGQLKIYFPGIKQPSNFYYSDTNIKVQDDFRALALIMLELLGFQKPQPEQEIKVLRFLVKNQRYSEIFIFALLCMLQKKIKFIDEAIVKLLKIDNKELSEKLSEQGKQYFQNEIQAGGSKKIQNIKRVTQKIQFTPPLIKHGDHTPKKTLQMTKKYVKAEDVENKKVFEESKKKKPTQQALKKVSNGKQEGQNASIVSPNYKKILRDIRQTKEREDLFKMAVTIKRMRTLSKKKIG